MITESQYAVAKGIVEAYEEQNKTGSFFDELSAILESYRDTLVIDLSFKVSRLVDLVEFDGEYYWQLDHYGTTRNYSCLVDDVWIPLKNELKDGDYQLLLRVWNKNNEIKAI